MKFVIQSQTQYLCGRLMYLLFGEKRKLRKNTTKKIRNERFQVFRLLIRSIIITDNSLLFRSSKHY